MKIIGNLIRLVFPHKAWPYPNGKKQIRQVVIVSAVIVFVALGGIIVGLEWQQRKSLSRQDVELAAKNLTSYSNEILLLAQKTQQQPLVHPYREVYLQKLDDNVSKVRKKLSEHAINVDVQAQTGQLLSVSDQLEQILEAFARESSDQTLSGDIPRLQALAAQSRQIEESL